ncbi:MAG: hypothetical protein QOC96_2612 [Acidobacteriota bacterium]|nr:hypothetical protein [Acidobacteriota bacterium]
MTQTRTPPRSIYRRRGPHTLIVAPAMLNALKHRSNACFRIRADDSGDTAHTKWSVVSGQWSVGSVFSTDH